MTLAQKALATVSLAVVFNVSLMAQTYTIQNKTLKEAIQIIASQSKLSYAGDPALLESKKANNIENIDGLEKALEALLKGTGLEAIVKDQTIILKMSSDVSTLSAISISSSQDNTTEGTGSYTTKSTSTATKLAMSLKETPQSISVITHQRMEDQGLMSITDVLEQTPGISVQSLGSGRSTIYSRGGYVISNYQFDGIPTYSDGGTQNVPQGLADMVLYDHVEVLRGAAGLTTGAGDPSGIINLVRKKPTKELQASISSTVGSWDLYRTQVDVSSALNESGTIRGRIVSAYQENESFQDYFKEEKKIVYGVVEADVTDTTLLRVGMDYQEYRPKANTSVGSILFYDDGSRINIARSNNQATKWSYDELDTYNAYATLEQELMHHWKMKTSVNYLTTDREFNAAEAAWGFLNEATGDGVALYGGSGEAKQTQKGFDMSLDGPFELGGREHQLIAGFSYSKYENNHMPLYDLSGVEGRAINYYTWGNDTAQPINDGKLYDWDNLITQQGVYVASRLNPVDDLSIILGTRFSHYKYEDNWNYIPASLSAYSNQTHYSENAITPYAGIVYDLTKEHAIYASYTSIFQPQNFKDRNAKTLDPKEGNNYEIGYKNELLDGALSSSFAVYWLKQEKLAVVDSGYTIIGTTDAAYKMEDGAETKGFDIEVTGRLSENWQLMGSYTFSKTKNQNDERINTLYPEHIVKLWTTYKLGQLTLGGGVNWQSKIYFDIESWQLPGIELYADQKSYTIFNTMAKYDFTHHLSATLHINNLFDKKYFSSLDETFYTGAYGDPRNATLSLKYTY